MIVCAIAVHWTDGKSVLLAGFRLSIKPETFLKVIDTIFVGQPTQRSAPEAKLWKLFCRSWNRITMRDFWAARRVRYCFEFLFRRFAMNSCVIDVLKKDWEGKKHFAVWEAIRPWRAAWAAGWQQQPLSLILIESLDLSRRKEEAKAEAEKKQPFCLLQSTLLDTVLSFTPQCNVKCCVMLLHEHSTVRIANSRYNCLSFSNYGNFSFRFQMKKATAADQNAVPFFFIYLFPDFWLLSHQIKWNGTFPRRWTFHSLKI